MGRLGISRKNSLSLNGRRKTCGGVIGVIVFQEELLWICVLNFFSVLKKMREAYRLSKGGPADAVSKVKEESEGKREENEKLEDDAESGSPHEPDHVYYDVSRSLTQTSTQHSE